MIPVFLEFIFIVSGQAAPIKFINEKKSLSMHGVLPFK